MIVDWPTDWIIIPFSSSSLCSPFCLRPLYAHFPLDMFVCLLCIDVLCLCNELWILLAKWHRESVFSFNNQLSSPLSQTRVVVHELTTSLHMKRRKKKLSFSSMGWTAIKKVTSAFWSRSIPVLFEILVTRQRHSTIIIARYKTQNIQRHRGRHTQKSLGFALGFCQHEMDTFPDDFLPEDSIRLYLCHCASMYVAIEIGRKVMWGNKRRKTHRHTNANANANAKAEQSRVNARVHQMCRVELSEHRPSRPFLSLSLSIPPWSDRHRSKIDFLLFSKRPRIQNKNKRWWWCWGVSTTQT